MGRAARFIGGPFSGLAAAAAAFHLVIRAKAPNDPLVTVGIARDHLALSSPWGWSSAARAMSLMRSRACDALSFGM